MAKLSKEMVQKLQYQALSDFWDWGELGRAEVAPFRIVRWLSKEKSARIQSQIKGICDKWNALLKTIPETKAYEAFDYFDHKNCPETWNIWKQHNFCFRDYEDNAIEETLFGHKLYVKCLTSIVEGKRKHRIRLMDKPIISFGVNVNRTYDSGRYARDYDHLFIYWNEERQQYKVIEYVYVFNEGMSEEEFRNHRGKNWPRRKFQNEIKRKTVAKARELAKGGVNILEIKPVEQLPGSDKWIHGYIRYNHKYFIDCVSDVEIA